MLRLIKRIIIKESGQALPVAVIVLALSGLVVVPVLDHTTDSLKNSVRMEKAADQVYAAESGVMEAIWELKFNGLTLSQDDQFLLPEFTINDETVNATINKVLGPICMIISKTNNDEDTDTIIRTFVYSPDPFIPENFEQIPGNFSLGTNENYFGNIDVDGNVHISYDAVIYGHINATGNIFLDTDAHVVGDIYSVGEILLSEDAHVEGTVITDDNIELAATASIEGDACAGGNILLYQDASIHGNVYAGQNVTLHTDATIKKNAYIGGTLKLYDGAEIFGDYPLGYSGCEAELGSKEFTKILSWDISRCE
jgi:cytoskeletal protein CcmA (bactofilin family)